MITSTQPLSVELYDDFVALSKQQSRRLSMKKDYAKMLQQIQDAQQNLNKVSKPMVDMVQALCEASINIYNTDKDPRFAPDSIKISYDWGKCRFSFFAEMAYSNGDEPVDLLNDTSVSKIERELTPIINEKLRARTLIT